MSKFGLEEDEEDEVEEGRVRAGNRGWTTPRYGKKMVDVEDGVREDGVDEGVEEEDEVDEGVEEDEEVNPQDEDDKSSDTTDEGGKEKAVDVEEGAESAELVVAKEITAG